MSRKRRTVAALVVLLTTCAVVYGYWIVKAPPMLDEATVVRRAYLSPWRCETYEERFYSVDWPAFARWTWRGIFTVTGWHWEEFDDEHFQFQKETPLFPANIRLLDEENSGVVPRGPVYVLRGTAAFFLTATCVALFFLTLQLLKSRTAGLLMAAPFLFHPAIGKWMIGYPGTDAIILFWMVAFLALWTHLHVEGAAAKPRGVLSLAVVAGLAAATKINGGLLTVAFVMYLTAFGEKRTRWWLMPVFCLVAFGVFLAINPVFWKPGAGGLVEGLRDVFARRTEVMEVQRKYLTVVERSAYFRTRLLLLPLVPLAGIALWKVRREAWLAPASIWAVTVCLGSYAMLNRYDARLAMPIDIGAIVVTGLAVLSIALAWIRRGADASPEVIDSG